MGNSTGNANKKSTKTSPTDKKERYRNKRKEGTGNMGIITVQLEEINQKVLAKEGRLNRYRQRVKQYRKNRTFQNNERKFYKQLGGSDTKTYQKPNIKETERFWTKIWQPRKQRKRWMDKQYHKRTRGTWRRPRNGNTRRLTQNNIKKNIKLESTSAWWNTWILVQEIHLHSRQSSTRNEQMLTRRLSTWMDDQRKDYINPKGPEQRNCSKQLQTHNPPTNDVENINSKNKGKDLLLANKPRIVPWRTERMPQRIQRHSGITLCRSTHPKWEQDKTEKSRYGLDWLRKGIWYGPTKQDTTQSQNVQNITRSHKLHRTDHDNLKNRPDNRRKKHNWNKDPKMHFPRRCTITLTIHNSHDATEPHSQKRRSRIHTQQIRREDQPPDVHGWHKIICKKSKRIGNSYTHRHNIQPGHRNGIWHRKMCMLVMKSGKRHMTDGIELPNQDRIRTLEEKESYKYLGILEADTIKQVQMKDMIRKENAKTTRDKNLQQKPHQRNKYLGCGPCQILGTLSQVDQRGT